MPGGSGSSRCWPGSRAGGAPGQGLQGAGKDSRCAHSYNGTFSACQQQKTTMLKISKNKSVLVRTDLNRSIGVI